MAHLLQLRSDVSRKTFHLLDPLGAAIRAARSAHGAAELTGRDFLARNEGLFTDPRDSTARPCRLLAIDQEGPRTARRAPFCCKLLTCRASSRAAGRPSSIALSRLTRDADGRSTFRSCYVIFHLPRLYGAKNDDGSPGAQTYVALEANGCTMFPGHAMGNMVFLQYVRVFGTQVKPAGGYASALDAHELAGRTPLEHNLWGASELLRVCVPGAAHAGALFADAARAGSRRSRGRPASCCTTPGATRWVPHGCCVSCWASPSPRASRLWTWSRRQKHCAIGTGSNRLRFARAHALTRSRSMIAPACLNKETRLWLKSSLQHLSFLLVSREASQAGTLGLYEFRGHSVQLHCCQTDVALTVLAGVELADALFSTEVRAFASLPSRSARASRHG